MFGHDDKQQHHHQGGAPQQFGGPQQLGGPQGGPHGGPHGGPQGGYQQAPPQKAGILDFNGDGHVSGKEKLLTGAGILAAAGGIAYGVKKHNENKNEHH